MKLMILLFALFSILSADLVTAQNITSTSQPQGMNIPFIGTVTLVGGIVGIVFFIIGYIIGQSIKSGIKIAFIFLIFIAILYILGILSKELITKIAEGLSALKPFAESLQHGFGMGSGALNFQLVMFFAGLVLGLIKG